MKIYTKSGDDGKTGLFRGPRVSKDDARIEAYGTVDELCAVVGLARSGQPGSEIDDVLAQIQDDLFVLGADLAAPSSDEPSMDAERTEWIESQIDRVEALLPPLTNFVLPTGTATAAALHHARVVCRRAERRVVTLAQQANIRPDAMIYLNRTSDLLFVLARWANRSAGQSDIVWRPRPAD